MPNDTQLLLQAVRAYQSAIHSQSPAAFRALWADSCETSLISISTCYRGTDAICNDFIGRLRQAYSRIELIAKEVSVRLVSRDCAVVLFSYQTDCDRRETGEHYGISGLETQVYVREAGSWKLAHVQYAKEN